jgi:hypothetical protein
MASESTEGRTMSLDIPATLDEWLTERATELEMDREELVVQLVGSYRATADTVAAADTETAFESAVEEAVAGATPDEAAIAERVRERMDSRVDELAAETDEKLDDVRRRVLQVKEQAASRAAADHDHEEFARLADLETQVEDLHERLLAVAQHVEETEAASQEELATVEQKLNRLARVVVDMRDATASGSGEAAVLADIKRTAAREDYETAICDACGERVRVAALPEPACPHCTNEFGDIVGGSGGLLGLFSSDPRLTGRHAAADSGDGGGDPLGDLPDGEGTTDGTGSDGETAGAADEAMTADATTDGEGDDDD